MRSGGGASRVLSDGSFFFPCASCATVLAVPRKECVTDVEDGLCRYMNQLLYGCQRTRCGTATCYTFRKTLSRNTNASRKLTVLSARIIACHLATQDDPFKALCPGKPVVPVMSSHSEEKDGPSRDSSFKEEIHEDDDVEKENKEAAKVPPETKEKKKYREGEVETVTDKGLKDPKSFPQQLFNTMSLKMVEWIGLPPLANSLKFSPDTSLPSTPQLPSMHGPHSPESTPSSPHEQPPKYKFHSNPMELIDTGRLYRDSEPVSQHRHQEILQAPPPQKRRSSNPAQKAVGVVPPTTPHSNTAKAKMSASGAWGMPPPPAPPPIGAHHAHHRPRQFVPQTPQVTPSKGERYQTSSQTTANEACVAPPQSLAKLDSEICAALAELCMSGSAGDRKDAGLFARQSIFYVFSTPEALLKSFVAKSAEEEEIDLDMYDIDTALRSMTLMPEWENMIMRSLWMGLESVFSVGLADRDIARLIALALQVLAAIVPRSTPDEWEATRKLRSSGRVSGSGAISEIGFVFENEMAERLMRRVVRAIAYATVFRDGVVHWLGGYLAKCGRVQKEERRRETESELGEELARGVERGGGGWGLGVCTLEWGRAVLLKAWDGQETAKRNSMVASCLVLLEILYIDHKAYGLEPGYFHTSVLSDRFDAKDVPVQWFNAPVSSSIVHFLDRPFLFPPHSLVTYFRAINLSHMSRAYEQSMTISRLISQMSMNTSLLNPQDETLLRRMHIALSTYLLIEVNRSTVLQDALNQVFRRELRELQRPLKVRFVNNGEEGVDHGGVQQEFFIIALREALRAEYGMWNTDERTRTAWFSVCTVEPVHKYELLGLLVGLAVYNGVTLPVAFPKAMYMKLLGETPREIKDIRDGWPELARGLAGLLEWEGDVADVFMRTYEFSYEAFGNVKHVDMLKAAEKGMEFLEETIEKPPPSKDKRKKEEEKKEADTVEALLDLGNWLPAPMPDDDDPWAGGLGEVLGVLDREQVAELRVRRYEVTFTEWPGEGGTWEDLDDGARGGAGGAGGAGVRGRVETEAEAEIETEAETETEARSGSGDVIVAVEEKKESEGGKGEPESEDDDDDDVHNSMTHDGGVRLFEIPPAPESEYEMVESKPEEQDDPVQEGAEGGSPGPTGVPEPAAEINSLDVCAEKDKLIPSHIQESLSEEPREEAELVTNANREQYVMDYISWLTDRSIRRQYQAFEKGFLTVLNKRALSLFTPSSLQNLVEGIQEIDIEGLEKTARYDDGYGPEHKTIRDFWGIVRVFSPERKRQLLEFVTASDRVPVNGIGSIMFVIQRNGPDSDVSSFSPPFKIRDDD